MCIPPGATETSSHCHHLYPSSRVLDLPHTADIATHSLSDMEGVDKHGSIHIDAEGDGEVYENVGLLEVL